MRRVFKTWKAKTLVYIGTFLDKSRTFQNFRLDFKFSCLRYISGSIGKVLVAIRSVGNTVVKCSIEQYN